MTTIDPSLLLSSAQQKNSTTSASSTSSTSSSSVLDKNAFLNLLVTQLKNQDPSQPMDDSQFISQMANFTSLEQTENMDNLLTKFIDSQSSAALGTQASMIGKTITWTTGGSSDPSSSHSTDTTSTQSGVVTAVSIKNGQVSYTVGNTAVDPTTITQIESDTQAAGSGAAANGGQA